MHGSKLGGAWERWAGPGDRVALPGGDQACAEGCGQREGRDLARGTDEESDQGSCNRREGRDRGDGGDGGDIGETLGRHWGETLGPD